MRVTKGLTPFGKEVRKLRVDVGILLGDFAESVGVSSSFLSAVEHGDKSVPSDLADKIINKYNVDPARAGLLRKLGSESVREVRVPLVDADAKSRGLAVAFARKFPELTEEQRDNMMRFLGEV